MTKDNILKITFVRYLTLVCDVADSLDKILKSKTTDAQERIEHSALITRKQELEDLLNSFGYDCEAIEFDFDYYCRDRISTCTFPYDRRQRECIQDYVENYLCH